MSGLSKFLDRLKRIPGLLQVYDNLRDLLQKSAPALYAVLTAMQVNQHRQAAIAFLSWGSVVSVVAHVLRIGAAQAEMLLSMEPVIVGVTRAFEKIDDLIDEEKAIAFMELLRLPREASEHVPDSPSPA